MKGDLKLLRKRWWGFFVISPLFLLFALPIALISIDNLKTDNWVGAIMGFTIAGVCLLVSVGLYAPYTFFYAFKLVGLVVFLGYVAYAIDCLQAGIIFASTRAEPAFINAITGLFYWGIPGWLLFAKLNRPEHSPYAEDGRLIIMASEDGCQDQEDRAE